MLKKYLLISLLLALVLLAGPAVMSAQEPDGTTQDQAKQLLATNTGHLVQLTEQWYTFSVSNPAYRGIETLELLLFYENGQIVASSDRTRYPYSDFYLYSDNLEQLGSGKTWTGQIEGGKQYWVKVVNQSDYEVDFVLLYQSDYVPPEPEPEPIEKPEIDLPAETEELEGVPFLTENGPTPAEATEFSLTSLTRGRVDSETTGWRAVSFADPDNTNNRRQLTITCFATPFDGNTARQAQFRLYEIGKAEKWDYHSLDALEEFGAVEFNLRHNMAGAFGNGLVPAQFVWEGWLTAGDDYVLAVQNGTDHEIDFWCFPQQMDNAELGEPSIWVTPTFLPGEAPANPLQLALDNEPRVVPEQQLWYSFVIDDPDDGEALEHIVINLTFTPNNGSQGYNEAYRVNFDVYNAADLAYWSVTDFDNLQVRSFGGGSAVVRDNNPDTGEMTWDGWVIDGNLYYVQVRNGARYPIDAQIEVKPHTASAFTAPTLSGGFLE
jgi:hypothetical protein